MRNKKDALGLHVQPGEKDQEKKGQAVTNPRKAKRREKGSWFDKRKAFGPLKTSRRTVVHIKSDEHSPPEEGL